MLFGMAIFVKPGKERVQGADIDVARSRLKSFPPHRNNELIEAVFRKLAFKLYPGVERDLVGFESVG